MWELGGRMYLKGTRNTLSSCPFLCFTQNGQINVTASPAASRPAAASIGTQGSHRNAPEDLPVDDPIPILQENHSCLHIGNLAIPMHIRDVEIIDIRKRHQIGAFTSRATVPGLGSSTTSGAEPSTAVGGPGIH